LGSVSDIFWRCSAKTLLNQLRSRVPTGAHIVVSECTGDWIVL
jgi:hypothetical protein